MTTKKIKTGITAYCPYCKNEGKEKVPAVWRGTYLSDRACDAHKDKLPKELRDDHYSEADYQTWMRL